MPECTSSSSAAPGLAAKGSLRTAKGGTFTSWALYLNKCAATWAPHWALLVIMLLGFGLRLYRLGDQDIWWDEGHAIWAARQSLAQATDITARDVHPPLYLWLLHGWLGLVGASEFAVRYLSLMAGVTTVALTVVVGRRLLGHQAGLLAALFLAMARFHIWWSQEARMYIWATLFALLSLYLMTRLRHAGHLTWWLYMLSSLAALYTLYLSVLALLVQNTLVLLTMWRKPRGLRFLLDWCLAQLGIAVLYFPWVYVALSRTRTDTARSSFPFSLVWQLYGTLVSTGISTELDRYLWLVVPFAIIAGAGLVWLFLDRRQPQRSGLAGWEVGLLLLLSLVLPPLVIYGLSIPRGAFYSPKPEARYLLVLSPLFYILLGGTVAGFWHRGGRWGKVAALLAGVWALGTFVSVLPGHYSGRYLRDEYQTAIRTLRAYAEPGDGLLLVSGDRYPIFLYHYQRLFPNGDGPTVYLVPRQGALLTAENVESELAPLSERHARLWLASFERTLQDPDNLTEQWLNAHRPRLLDVPEQYNYLRLYGPRPATSDATPGPVRLARVQPQHPLGQPLSHGLLVGYDLATTEFRPGDTVRPGLYIQTQEQLNLRVRWVNQAEQPIAEQMVAVPGPEGGQDVALVAPAFAVYPYTEPGSYRFEVCAGTGVADCVTIPAGRVTHSRRLPVAGPVTPSRTEIGNGLIWFLGYGTTLGSQVRAGGVLCVQLHWQAQTWVRQDYTVFVHLLGPFNPATGGPIWAQDDSQPLGDGHPTTRWLPGQTVPDRHCLPISADIPPGIYQIEVGLYDPRTGERLSVAGSDDNRVLLDPIEIIR